MDGRSRSWRRFAAALLLVAAAPGGAAAAVAYWGQVQAHLESFNGAPLVAANWDGRYRPFVFQHGRYVALLPRDDDASARLDLYSPVPLSASEILLAGSDSGRPAYDIFHYDTRTRALTNLTATPAVDEGRLCVFAAERLIAMRVAGEEQVARVADGRLTRLAHARLPSFEHCVWRDARTLLGVERDGGEYRLHRCTVDGDAVTCAPSPALAGVDALVALADIDSTPGAIARRREDLFRRPFVFVDGLTRLAPAAVAGDVAGDVLGVDGVAVRSGLHGRYTSSLAPTSTATVYATRRIGEATFGIVATERAPRTLARLGVRGWEPLPYPGVVAPADAEVAREVWMRSPAGELYQAFYFGASAPRRVVVWWHGGPAESVSPRFNPYFYELNRRGYGVLAVNYPGSTGRGAEYERRFAEHWILDCIQAVWTYLRDNDVRVVVSWSVSSGNVVQSILVRHDVPVSTVVDQAGFGRTTLLEDTSRRRVPFFAIRGRNDPNGPIAKVDYWYPDGHDIISAPDFAALFATVAPFLEGAPAVVYAAANAPAPRLRIDTPPSSDDPRVDAEEQALTFELATHVARECFAAGEVAFAHAATMELVHEDVGGAAASLPRVTLRLRPGHAHAGPGGVVLQPIDARAPAERARLRLREIDRDGTIVHPRLRTIARELCARVGAIARPASTAVDGPTPSPPIDQR